MTAHRAKRGRREEMLRAGDRALAEIAAEAGFSDQAHFTRAFRVSRTAGFRPSAARRR